MKKLINVALIVSVLVLQVVAQRSNVAQVRTASAKVNTVVCFVPQQEAWVIERFGKFHKTLEPVSLFLTRPAE